MQSHIESSFVTLTYNNTFLPYDKSFNDSDLVLFFKKLRGLFYEEDLKKAERCERPVFRDIRYYLCGEYGELLGRPHYHIALFGVGQSEKDRRKVEEAWSYSVGKQNYSLGFCFFGELNKHSAAYIAGYIMKGANRDPIKSKDKRFKEKVEKHLQGRLPEFQRMSRGRAIGSVTVERYASHARNRKFDRYRIERKTYHLGKTLKAKASKITGTGVNSDDYYNYINELFSKMEGGETLRGTVHRLYEGAREKQFKRTRIFNRRKKL